MSSKRDGASSPRHARGSWPPARSRVRTCSPLFRNPGCGTGSESIIEMLGRVKSRGCVGDVVALLEEHDRFWATQDLEKGWWNREVGSSLTHRRRDVYGEDYRAVIALGRIGDARAREAIEATRRRWRAIDFENPQIVEACKAPSRPSPKREAIREGPCRVREIHLFETHQEDWYGSRTRQKAHPFRDAGVRARSAGSWTGAW